MWIVVFLANGAPKIEAQHYGPFPSWGAAYDKLAQLPPASEAEHKYIVELIP